MKPALSYAQLREILALVVSNGTLRLKLADLLQGKAANLTEVELLDLIVQSEVDKDLIRILSNKDPDAMDALEGLEYISSFFAYTRANSARLTTWLANIGLRAQASVKKTPSKPSK